MSLAAIAIDRASLSKPDLAASSDGSTYRLTEDGVGRPGVAWRRTYAPDSADVHGSELIAIAREQSSLPLVIEVLAETASALDDACADLEEALSQFAYTVTQTVDGVTRVWSADPADWSTGGYDSGEVAAHMARYVITIPVYPISELIEES